MAREFYSEEMLNWLSLILFERFGLNLSLAVSNAELVLSFDSSNKKIIFPSLDPQFYVAGSDLKCFWWNSVEAGFECVLEPLIPAPSSLKIPEKLIVFNEEGASIHYDILGLAYWMLTRLEEVGSRELDAHQRFLSTSSHAFKHNYLERPIVDEWLNILSQVIQRVWPEIHLKQHEFSMRVSHDVDSPSLYAFKPWKTIIRMMVGHLIKRRDINAFFLALLVKLTTRKELVKSDPYNTFDWLMGVSEANNIKSAFYFISGRTDRDKDADYEIDHPIIRNLIVHIHRRGHEIGLHPSFNTYLHPNLIEQEYMRLKKVCSEVGVTQKIWGGRMHYLRWKHPITMRAWSCAGLNYDATLGYADRPGFRSGTCYEYQAFDPVEQKELNLRLRPLVVMESSVISDVYLGMGVTKNAENKMKLLKNRCRAVNGCFELLWHNSYFLESDLKSMYCRVLRD
ncbi:MAG: hypothetical protein HWE39_22650 [Oceanospirillaceae bacterium]|nr:hypothetical protein [Oceanospirillaceae bacterium]